MSEKCVHEWYYRIVDIVSWQFFCIRCGEKLSMDKFSDRATELEKNADALNARIAELEAAQRWIPVKEKLPNLFETVLIWAYCDCDGYDRFDLAFNSGLVWVGTQQDIEYEDVTHWMPLPQPPEVQE